MHKIIICADDYGLTASVNRAIEACLKAGAVQSTCVMPNMEFSGAAKLISTNIPNASVGLHWTLTLGRPISSVRMVPSLVNDKGHFHNFTEFRKRLKTGKISFDEIQIELSKQSDRLKGLLGKIEFWNTHQNVHLWPGLFQLCVKLALRAGIQKMRSNSRITLTQNRMKYNLQHVNYLVKGIILDFWSNSYRRKGIVMPDGLIAMPGAGAGKMCLEEYFKRFRIPKGRKIIEASLHPADEMDHPLFGKLTNSRFHEYKVFTDIELKNRLSKLGFKCISYRHLAI